MATAVYQQVAQHVSDMFTPLPEERAPTAPRKYGFEYTTKYVDAVWGTWDLWLVLSNALDHIKNLSFLNDSGRDFTERLSGVTNLSGMAMSIPALFTTANGFRKNIFAFAHAQDLPYSDGLRHQKILQTGKNAVTSGMTFTWVLSQAALFAHEVKIIDLGKNLPVVNVVAQGASIIADGSELVEDIYKVNAYRAAQALTNNPQEGAQLEENLWLSFMRIVKNVSSLAMSTIALIAIGVGVVTSTLPIVAPIVLGLMTVWLAAKISSQLYDEFLKYRRAALT